MIAGFKTTLGICLLLLVSTALNAAGNGLHLPIYGRDDPDGLPYFALNLCRQFDGPDPVRPDDMDIVGLAMENGSFQFPEINSEEFRLGYGYEPPSIGEQLLYSVGMILLQAGGSRLEAATR